MPPPFFLFSLFFFLIIETRHSKKSIYIENRTWGQFLLVWPFSFCIRSQGQPVLLQDLNNESLKQSSSHSWGKDGRGQGSSLNPWWGQWDGLGWSCFPGWDFTRELLHQAPWWEFQGRNSKVSCKVGFMVLSHLWGSAPCAAERSLPPRSALGWGAPSITLIWLLCKSNF